MVKKLFVLGRTGSGKSTTVRLLTDELRQIGWTVEHFNDYPFLREMFKADDGTHFRSTELDGFEVREPSLPVYEQAFRRLKKTIQCYQPSSAHTIITIEFTSNNYRQALNLFGEDFLQNAYYLFLATDLRTCLQRVDRRASKPQGPDDYFVPETVLLQHYPTPYMPPTIRQGHVTLVPNMESLVELRANVKSLVPDLLKNIEQTSPERLLVPVS